MKRGLTLVMAVLMVISLFTAGGSFAFAEGTDTIEVTDMKGRTVTLPRDVERVVVTFNMEEYFAVSGETGIDKLVGWSHKYWEGRRQDCPLPVLLFCLHRGCPDCRGLSGLPALDQRCA